MDHADFISSFGVDRLTSEKNLFGKRRADDLHQFMAERKRHDQTEPSQGHAEAGSIRGYSQVAMQRQFTSPSEGITLHHSNSGVARAFDLLEDFGDAGLRVATTGLA